MIKTIHPAITRLFQYKFCNLFGLTIQEWSLVLKSSKNKKEDCENQLHNLALSKVYIMCSCIVPRGHYTFLYQQRVNTPLPPHQLLNGDIQRPLACLAKSYLRSWLSGVGEYSRMIKKKKKHVDACRLAQEHILAGFPSNVHLVLSIFLPIKASSILLWSSLRVKRNLKHGHTGLH